MNEYFRKPNLSSVRQQYLEPLNYPYIEGEYTYLLNKYEIIDKLGSTRDE